MSDAEYQTVSDIIAERDSLKAEVEQLREANLQFRDSRLTEVEKIWHMANDLVTKDAQIERLRDLLREAHEKNVSVGWFQRVREALGDE